MDNERFACVAFRCVSSSPREAIFSGGGGTSFPPYCRCKRRKCPNGLRWGVSFTHVFRLELSRLWLEHHRMYETYKAVNVFPWGYAGRRADAFGVAMSQLM
eukprot:4332478-Amphidinium_carterae.1